MDRSFRLKISKKMLDLNYTLDQMDLTNVHRTSHLTAVEYTLLSAHEHSQDRSYDRPQNKSQQFKKTEIVSGIFSNHNDMKIEISNRICNVPFAMVAHIFTDFEEQGLDISDSHYSAHKSLSSGHQRFMSITREKFIHYIVGSPKVSTH